MPFFINATSVWVCTLGSHLIPCIFNVTIPTDVFHQHHPRAPSLDDT